MSRYESSRRSKNIEVEEPSYSLATKRLSKELEEIKNNPPPNIFAYLKGNNLYKWKATIQGPPDSPYEGGMFLLDIIFPKRYPFEAPKVTFLTKVYHCNINCEGWVSVDILHKNWSPRFSPSALLLSIQSLLTDCNPEDPLVPEIAAQYVNDREEYDRICREWTKKYATEESEL